MQIKYPFRVEVVVLYGLERRTRTYNTSNLDDARKHIRDASRRPNYIVSDLWVHLDRNGRDDNGTITQT